MEYKNKNDQGILNGIQKLCITFQEILMKSGLSQQSFKFAKSLKPISQNSEYDSPSQISLKNINSNFLTIRENYQGLTSQRDEPKQQGILLRDGERLKGKSMQKPKNTQIKSEPEKVKETYDLQQQGDNLQTEVLQKLINQFKQKNIVQKFLNNLIDRSYVFSNQKSKLIQTNYLQEEYVKEKLQKKSRKNQKNQTNENKQNMNLKIPIFEPLNKFLFIWEIFMSFTLIFLLLWVPFQVAFEVDQSFDKSIISYIIILNIIFDILFQLNKGYIEQGQLITNRTQILKYYLQNRAYKDMGTLTSQLLFIFSQDLRVLIVIVNVLFILSRTIVCLKTFEKNFDDRNSSSDFIDIIKLLSMIFYFAHLIACIWHYISLISLREGLQSWIVYYEISDKSVWTHYNYSLYWATMTMVTVGYGDITPKNNWELLTANIIMFFACGVFAFSVNSIGIVLQNINEGKQKHKRAFSILNNYLNTNGVDLTLQNRVRNYLDFYNQKQNEASDEAIQSVIGKLSKQLKEEVLYQVMSKIIAKNKVLQLDFKEPTHRKLVLQMECLNYCPDDKIFKQNSNDDQSLFIIQKGEVTLLEESSQKILGKFREGDSFGEWSFFTGQPRTCSIISSGFSKVYRIKRDIFLQIIKDVPEEIQKFNEIKDRMIFAKDLSACKIACLCCSSNSHMITQCPSLLYIPDLERLVKQDMFNQSQMRIPFDRKTQLSVRLKSISDLNQIQRQLTEFVNNMCDQNSLFQAENQDSAGSSDSKFSQNESIKSSSSSENVQSLLSYKEKQNDERRQSIQQTTKAQENNNKIKLQQRDQQKKKQLTLLLDSKIKRDSILAQEQECTLEEQYFDEKNFLRGRQSLRSESPQSALLQKEPTYKAKQNIQVKGLLDLKQKSNQNQNSPISKSQLQLEWNHTDTLINQFQIVFGKNLDIDLVMNFKNYFEEWNVDNVCKYISKIYRNRKKWQKEVNVSKYSFYFQTKKLMTKIQHYFKQSQKRIINKKDYSRQDVDIKSIVNS